jgi:hypothetical protein
MVFLLFSDFADMAGAQSGTNPPDPFSRRTGYQPVLVQPAAGRPLIY